jgi:dTDP-4-amino-4,6-dideoxy-D-glucose acyltransferase
MGSMGFAAFGEDVRLSDRASYYNCAQIRFGNHVRVDDFCVLSAGAGGIVVGDYVHVAVYAAMLGAGRIELADFSCISSRVVVYSSNDDYSGATMTNPQVPDEYRGVKHAPVFIGRHVVVGAGSIVLPGVTLQEGSAVGALSLVKSDCEAFGLYAGVPARRLGERKRDLLELEQRFRRSTAS